MPATEANQTELHIYNIIYRYIYTHIQYNSTNSAIRIYTFLPSRMLEILMVFVGLGQGYKKPKSFPNKVLKLKNFS